jgi:hypothetical protein
MSASMVVLVSDELEINWKEGTSGPVKVLSMHLAGGTKNAMQRLGIIDATAKIQNRHLQIPFQCYHYTNLFDLKVVQMVFRHTLCPEIPNDTI